MERVINTKKNINTNLKGGKDGAVKTCSGCQGRGVKMVIRQMGPMIQQMQTTCGDCQGTGQIINMKDRCKICIGKKVVSERKVLNFIQLLLTKPSKDS